MLGFGVVQQLFVSLRGAMIWPMILPSGEID
jgi:hypothetical protein